MKKDKPNQNIWRRGGINPGQPVEKPADLKNSLKEFLKYFRKEKSKLLLLTILVLIAVLGTVSAPVFQSRAIDAIVIGKYDDVSSILLIMSSLYIMSALAMLTQARVTAKLSKSIILRLRKDIFTKTTYLPIYQIDALGKGDLISRMTNDADNISHIISTSLSALFSSILMLIGTFAIMLWLCIPLALLSCITIILSVIITGILSKYTRKYYVKRQILLGELNNTVEEEISNFQTVSAFNLQCRAIEKFNRSSNDLTKTGILAEVVGSSMGPIMNSLNNLTFLIVAVFGAWFVLQDMISVGVIAAFIVYSKQFSRPVNEIAQLYNQIQTALAGAERIFSILQIPSENLSGNQLSQFKQARIEFRNVSFGYQLNQQVIKNFSLTVEPGSKVALVGSTGSGKTTIINLLMRFYEPNEGSILINGENIQNIAVKDLRQHIGIVLQDTILFTDTIRNNLIYADHSLTQSDIDESLNFTGLTDFVASLPQGLDTMLIGAGAHLSQGQKQLFAICRAFLSSPDILILDEATSNVDTQTEKHIQDAMARLMNIGTCLVIAHRLSTIQDADKIIVMDHGQIVEMGNHKELLDRKGFYSELYQIQFAGQEI